MSNRCLAIISAKNPSYYLVDNITNIKRFYPEFDIVIVDNSSDDKSIYKMVPSDVKVEFTDLRNYEIGAFYYAYWKYNNYDIYMCIQDALIPKKRIDNFDSANFDKRAFYSCHYGAKISDGGFFDELHNVYRNTDFNFIVDIPADIYITGSAHSSFITSNENAKEILKIEDIYKTKGIVKTKVDSWLSERIVGVLSDWLGYKRINMGYDFNKVHGGRV